MSSKAEPQRTTVVGIGAQGNAEDWSSEFDLEGGNLLKSPSFRQKSLNISNEIKEVDFDDIVAQQDNIDFTDSDDDTILATNNNNYNMSRSSMGDALDTGSLSDEDWDDELGITDEVLESQESMLNGFRHVISDTLGLKHGGMLDELTKPLQQDDVVKTTIPARCKVVSMLLTRPDDFNMLVYPKSIPLYSLKLDGDKKQLMAMQLDDWLKNIVHKHKERIDHVMRAKDINWLREFQAKSKNFSRRLLNAWAEVVTILWRNNSLDVYDTLKNFLKLFRQFSKMDKYVVKDLSSMSEADYHMSFVQVVRLLRIAAMADVLESISGKYTDGAGKRNDHHFRMIITDNTPQAPTKTGRHNNLSGQGPFFPEILKCATVLFPDKLELLAVLELEAASHHVSVMLDNRIEFNYSPTPYDLFKAHIFLYRSISSSAREKTASHAELKASKSASRRDKDRYEEEMKNCETATTAILCDMCLLLNGHESLNVHYSKHLAAAIDMIFVEKNNIDRSSDESEDEHEEFFDVYTQTQSKSSGSSNRRQKTSSNRSHTSRSNTSRSNNSKSNNSKSNNSKSNNSRHSHHSHHSQSSSPKHGRDSKKFQYHATHTTTESVDPSDRKHSNSFGNAKSISNSSRSVSNLLSVSMHSKSSNHMSTRALSQDLFENDEIPLYEVFVKLRTHRFLVATLLSKKYKRVSRKSPLKPIVAYTLGLLQSQEEDTPGSQDRTESLWLECLVLLDKQSDSRLSEVAPPIVSLFAVGVIEAFAELLIKTSKYKFGVSSFEAVTECLLLLNSKDVKRLYRRLTNVSTEARDIKRSIYYHCVMLRIAIEEGKLNEFVYIADLVGKLFLEVGEAQLAERCLRVVALLHQGYTIKSVRFERINLDKLLLNGLPEGIEVPYIDLQADTETVPVASVPGALLWARRAKDSVQCDSQQLHAIMKLVEAYVVSDYHQMALALCACLLEKKVFPQGRIYVLLTMAKCYLKLRELKKCEATLDRIAYEADEIVTPLLNTASDDSPTTPDDGGSGSRGGHIRGSFVYGHQQHDSSFSGHSGESSSKRDIGKLNRISSEQRKSKNITRSGSINFFNDAHPSSSNHHTSAALLGVVTKVRSYEYILLRARCRLAADDPEWAILWLQIAISICPRGKFDRRGRIRYLTGRSYMLLCLRCHMGGGGVPPELAEQEAQYASKAEEEFRAASTLYKLTGDIVKETKTLSRITELHISRVFSEVAVEQSAPLHEALHGKAESTLRSLESLSRLAMQLAGDTSAPLELIRTLVNTSELSWLLGNVQLAFSAWYEAKTLLTITFLQCLSVETTPPPSLVLQRQSLPSNSNLSTQKIKKTFSFGSLSSLNTSTPAKNTSFSPADFIPDPLNPLSDAPLPVVKFAPGMLLRIYSLLTRLVRLAFVIEPCPLSHYGGNLLASWIRLNNVVSAMGTPLFGDIHGSLKKTVSSFNDICSSYHHPSADIGLKNKHAFSSEILDVLSYFSPDEEERRTLVEKMAQNGSPEGVKTEGTASPKKEARKSKKFSGDNLVDKEVTLAGLNILLPFEFMLRAFSVDGTEGVEVEGALATDIVLNYLRGSVCSSLLDPRGEKAGHVVTRGRAPGVTMTAAGHFVEGAMDYQAAEIFVKKHAAHYSDSTSKQRDLSMLLKRNNDVYSPSDGYLLTESNVYYSSEQPTFETDHRSGNVDANGKLEDTMALLLGSHPKKSRIQVLFLRLKSFSEQYALGHLSLTDYYRNNMDTLRCIVNAQGVIEDFYGTLTMKNERLDRMMLSRSFSTPCSPIAPPVSAPSPGVNKRSLVRSQTKEVMDQLEGGGQDNDLAADELRKCFAPSFRFVIQLEPNTLLLYVPRTNVTATAVFRPPPRSRDSRRWDRNKERDANGDNEASATHTTPVSCTRDLTSFFPSQDMHQADSGGRRGGGGTYRSSSLRIQTDPSLKSASMSASASDDRCALDDIYASAASSSPIHGRGGSGGLELPTTQSPSPPQLYLNPMATEGLKGAAAGAGGMTVNSMSHHVGNNDNKKPLSIKTNTMVSTLTVDASFNIGKGNPCINLLQNGLLDVSHNITSPVCPHYEWTDSAILSAYNSLPLPTEDIIEVKKAGHGETFEEKVKEAGDKAHAQEEEKYSVNELLCSLGLQKALFLVNALMLEEPVLLIIAPGSEQLLVHVATALLRLLRPLQWQHLYLPLMHSTLYPQFRTLIENHESFLVGSYHQVLAAEVEAHRAISSKLSLEKGKIDPFCLPRLSHVTIVDLNSGRIKPSSNLVFAHICTVFDPYAYDIPVGETGITPPLFFPEAANNPYFPPEQLPRWAVEREAQLRVHEADLDDNHRMTFRKHHSIEKINVQTSSRNLFDLYVKNKGHSSSSISEDDPSLPIDTPPTVRSVQMKPPIPVRYRAHVYERLYAVLFGMHLSQPVSDLLSKPFEKHSASGSGGTTPARPQQVLSAEVHMECSAVLLEAMFQVMISMFKGVKCFLRPATSLTPAGEVATPGGRRQRGGVDEARPIHGSFKVRKDIKKAAALSRHSKSFHQTYGQQMFALSDQAGGYDCKSCQALELVNGNKNLKMVTNSKLYKLLETGEVTQAKRNDGLSLPAIDEKQWVSFLRDDCQSFARHILHTTSFKLFCRDIALCQQNHQKHGRYKRFRMSEYFYAFMIRSHEKVWHKMTIYRTMSTHRMAGYLITYFGRIDAQLESQFGDDDDDDFNCDEGYNTDMFDINGSGSSDSRFMPYLHTFPFTPSRVKASLKTITNAKKEPPLKIKRRWCVLDAQRFTYFKSRSCTDAKNYISMDPSQVRLVMAPFNHHPQRLHFAPTAAESSLSGEPATKIIENNSNVTTISDTFALVCSAFVVILRAENLADHNRWLLAFRSRLLVPDTVNSNLAQHDNYKDTVGLLSPNDAVPKIALSSSLKQKYSSSSNKNSVPAVLPDRAFNYRNPEYLTRSHSRDKDDSSSSSQQAHKKPPPRSLASGRRSSSTDTAPVKSREVMNSTTSNSNNRNERPGHLLRGAIPTTKNTRDRENSNRERDRENGGVRRDRRSSERGSHKRPNQQKRSSGEKSTARRDIGSSHFS